MRTTEHYYQGQAQRLAEWVEMQKPRERTRVRYINIRRKAGQLFDDLFLYDTPRSRAMQKGLIIVIFILMSALTVVQMGLEKGWW